MMPFQAHNYLLLSRVKLNNNLKRIVWNEQLMRLECTYTLEQTGKQSSNGAIERFRHQDADDGVAMMGMSNAYSWTNWWSNLNAIYWKTVLIRFYNNSYPKYDAICDADDYICQFVYLKKKSTSEGFHFFKMCVHFSWRVFNSSSAYSIHVIFLRLFALCSHLTFFNDLIVIEFVLVLISKQLLAEAKKYHLKLKLF